jgi:predicted alpha/beta superfamily hydrolase
LDNRLEWALSVLETFGPELIVVSVGADATVSRREFFVRRTYDFGPTKDWSVAGPGGEYLRARQNSDALGELSGGGAQTFLDFLIDDVRPVLQAEYRMDPDDHALVGSSAGGTFVAYALFARPGSFARYLCGSPSLYVGDGIIFKLEQQYAAEHVDLPARVFFGAGEAEITQDYVAAVGCVSSMARLAETLSFRGYPSLRLTVKIFPGETHESKYLPFFSWSVRSVWTN